MKCCKALIECVLSAHKVIVLVLQSFCFVLCVLSNTT